MREFLNLSSFRLCLQELAPFCHIDNGCRGFVGPVPPPLWMSSYFFLVSLTTHMNDTRKNIKCQQFIILAVKIYISTCFLLGNTPNNITIIGQTIGINPSNTKNPLKFKSCNLRTHSEIWAINTKGSKITVIAVTNKNKKVPLQVLILINK